MAEIRKLVARVAIAGALGIVATASPVGAAAGTGCAPGYTDPGPVTLTQGLALERIQAGLAADPAPYTVAALTSLFNAIDGNHDGILCMKANSNLRGESGKHHGYFYLADDNTHPQD